MKFIKLTIHNLASIEDAEIDFENGPLAEDSRFLICGPTGAGKTTILDAICLVLYGTTPRLTNQKSESYVDQYENFRLLKEKTDVKINDTRMLMRRGSLNAFVELIFTDKDDKLLKAVWQCNRIYNKITGSIKEPDWLLFDGETDELLIDKKQTFWKEICVRIGLTFDQFCRTTMLAQGDFTKFLKSEEGEKSQILERLTGTDIYSEISIGIHQKKVEKENVCLQIASKLEGVQLLSEEEIQTIEQHKVELENKLGQLAKDENMLLSNHQWKSKLEGLVKEKNEVDIALKEQAEKEDSPLFKDEKSLLDDWQKTQIQRDSWKVKETSEQEIANRNVELQSLKTDYLQLSAGFLGLQYKLKEKFRIQDKIKNYLAAESPKEECYSHISLIEELTHQHMDALHQIKEANLKITQQQNLLKKVDTEVKVQEDNVKKYEEKRQECQHQIDVINLSLSSLNYENLLKERENNDIQLNQLREYRLLLDQCFQASAEKQRKSKLLAEHEDLVTKLRTEVAKSEQKVNESDHNLRVQKEVYEKQERACSDVMKEYRSRLHVGDTCPLCGHVITNLEDDAHFVSILQPVKELLDKIQLETEEEHKKYSDVKARYAVSKAELTNKQHELEVAAQNEKQLSGQLAAHSLYTVYGQNADAITKIDSALNALKDILANINAKLIEVGKIQGQINAIQQKKELIDKSLRSAEGKVQELIKRKVVINEACQNQQILIEKAKKTSEEKLNELSRFISMEEYHQKGAAYIEELKLGAQHFKYANEKMTDVEIHIKEISNEIRTVGQLKETVEKQQPLWAQQEVSSPCSIEHLQEAWIALQTKVSRLAEALALSEQQYAKAAQELASYFSSKEAVTEDRLRCLATKSFKEIESLAQKHQRVHDMRLKLVAQRDSAQHNLDAHLKNKPQFDEEMTLDELAKLVEDKKNEIKEQNQQLGMLSQSLETDKKNRANYALIEDELKKATLVSDRWNHLHKLFGSNDGKKFRNIAQSFVLEQLLVNANTYLSQFTNRYEMECQPGSLTILLRDKDAGGVLRPTTTISGGESFLISLSLALGLSSLSKSSLSMDTLFIDEGFGTLDSTYLSSVMDALERLHQMGGKKIGIISHVESLKERITTQIQVSRINNTLSKVNVVSLI